MPIIEDLQTDCTGQIILIGGIGLAVAFVALAVVLNAAIFTGALATTQSGVDELDALGYERSVERGVGGALFHLNAEHMDHDERVTRLRNSVRYWQGNASGHYLSDRVAARTTWSDVDNGSWIFQTTEQAFEDTDGDQNWTVASDTDGTRRFAMNVSRDSLHEEDVFADVANLTSSKPFTVTFSNGSADYEVVVYRDLSGNVVVQTVNASDEIVGECTVDSEYAIVDITEGTLAGEPCAPLDAPGVEGSYDVTYEYGSNVAGRYALVVNRTEADLHDDPYSTLTDLTGPYAVPAVYALEVNVSYRTDELGYTTTTTIAPEGGPQVNPAFGVAGIPIQPRDIVFANESNRLKSVNVSGHVQTYDPDNVAAIGPKKVDFDDDNRTEIPYVDGSKRLKLVDEQNETQVLAEKARKSNTLLGVGTWGNANFDRQTAVYYVNDSDSDLWRAWLDNGTVRKQELREKDGDGDGIKAVAGIADYNDDGDADIVFTDGSALVTYVDGGTTHETDENVGSNNGIGVGEPTDFDGDGNTRAPIVDGSNNVGLLPHSGTSEDLTSSGPATKSPVTGINLADSAGQEVVFIDTSSNTLHYVAQDGTITQFTDEDGDPISANDDQGVA